MLTFEEYCLKYLNYIPEEEDMLYLAKKLYEMYKEGFVYDEKEKFSDR